MLLVFMGLLNMTGGSTPIPPTPDKGGIGNISEYKELQARELKKKLLREDEEILLFIKTFIQLQ